MNNRLRYIGKRFLMAIPVVWLGTSMTWYIIFMGPIDPAANVLSQGETQNQAKYQAAREQLGLNEPPLQHYLDWMTNMATFDLGNTWLIYNFSPVNDLIIQFLPRTLWLGFWSVLVAVCIGVPLGFYAGLRSNTVADYLASFSGIVWRAMPNFWLAVMILTLLIQSESFLGFDWDTFVISIDAITGNPNLNYMADKQGLSNVWFYTDPVGIPLWPDYVNLGLLDFFFEPYSTLQAVKKILPAAIVLGSASMGNEMRIGRTAVLEVKNENYVDLARAKGVSGASIVWKHIFRNALIPLVPIITSEAFLLIGGSVLVETVFGINGIGLLFFQAAIQGDLPLVGTLMYVFILMIVGINLFQDLLYTVIDPRVGYEKT